VNRITGAARTDDARAALRTHGLNYTVVERSRFGPDERPCLVIVGDIVPASPPT